jgi:hypothetical protein
MRGDGNNRQIIETAVKEARILRGLSTQRESPKHIQDYKTLKPRVGSLLSDMCTAYESNGV